MAHPAVLDVIPQTWKSAQTRASNKSTVAGLTVATAPLLILGGCAHDDLVPLLVVAQISMAKSERMLALSGVFHQTVSVVS